METAAIVLCAGKSTRMHSSRSKMLHLVCGRPLCAWSIEQVLAVGAAPLKVVVGFQAEAVKSVLNSRYKNHVEFVLQEDQRGTGDAVKVAMHELESFAGTVLVLYGDTPLLEPGTLKQLVGFREQTKAKVAMLTTFLPEPTSYGRILRNDVGSIVGVIEENDADPQQKEITEINPGIYAFDSHFLRESLKKLVPHNVKKEYYLTDLVAMAAKQPNGITHLSVSALETLGVNDRVQLAHADEVLRKRIVHDWMKKGVSCINPDNVYIHADVRLDEDVILGPGVMLEGACQIGKRVQIEAGCILTDTQVDSDVRIKPYTICEGAVLAKNVEVGPFARLRPGTELSESVRIGNFVEVKKSKFGKSSKANHLAYIGDADIGEDSNVGAGTITCNYDGFNKNTTSIGKGVFIGSNSTLVAPLVVGDGAYVAAGSAVTKTVPAGAVAFGRTRQENKEGYADKIRNRFQKIKGKK